MSSILDVRNLYQNLLNLSLSEELEGPGSALSCCRSACSSDTALHSSSSSSSSGDSSAVWPLRSHWSPNGEQLRPPLRPDRSVSLIEGKAHVPPPPPGFPPLKQPALAPSSRYKTELCRTFSESGKCKYGAKCQFAHGSVELRTVSRHPKYKTELCHKFYIHGECPYGLRCHFIHYPEEAQFHSTATSSGASPQLLRQSVSFSGVPTARRTSPLSSLPDPASFTRAPSVSPPPASAELFSPAFEHLNVDPLSLVSLGDSLPATPANGCCSCRCGKSVGLASSLQSHRDFFSPAPGTPAATASALPRTSSSHSLSDPECYSSSSSLSGSDSPVFDLHPPGGPVGNPHRLPIFNRLSVSE